jgi:glycosyltransferase involved in cell wall biosynthesis
MIGEFSMTTSETGTNISVIVPNHNGAATLGETLAAIRRSDPAPLEVIVVDDASSDGSPKIAAEYPVRLIRHEKCLGASSSRNTGAREAKGDILLFIDNDVVIPPRTLGMIASHLGDRRISGVIGLLRATNRYRDFCSRYKNYYMHYTYLKLPEFVNVFYTSVAAIRKYVFWDCGGFDPSYRGATIEDMDFGLRVTGKGYKLLLDKKLQVEHLKHYTLGELLKTAFRRAAGLTRILLRDRMRRKRQSVYHTTSPSFTAGIALAYLALFFLLPAVSIRSWLWFLGAALSYTAIIILNRGLLLGLARSSRPLFFWLGCGFIFIDLLSHGLGNIWGVVSFSRGKTY